MADKLPTNPLISTLHKKTCTKLICTRTLSPNRIRSECLSDFSQLLDEVVEVIDFITFEEGLLVDLKEKVNEGAGG